jgi:hypothetical protein
MKKGTILMLIGGGLLVVYLVVLFVIMSSYYSGILPWLIGVPLQIHWGFAGFAAGNLQAASLGVLFSVGVITLLTGAGMSIFKPRARAKA